VTKFRITFGGRHYPSYRPISVAMFARDAAEATAWAVKQMEAWGVASPEKVKVDVREMKDEK
jgi:hypothetical protein